MTPSTPNPIPNANMKSSANVNHRDNSKCTRWPNQAVDESTRLLPCDDDESISISPSHNHRPPRTPLPKAQLSTLILVRIVDPIAYQQIFPYINQLLVDLQIVEPEHVGFYSGLVESAYSLAQVFSAYQWGKISDVVGRRPVVFASLIGIALASAMFGLSTTLASIIAFRFLGGLVAGNVAVIHSILAEITDDTNQDVAAPIYGLSWPLGTVIGPLIGGTLENAATRYPQYFSWQIFVKHPYLPPCIATAACALIAAGIGYVFIEETLPGTHTNESTSSISGSQTDLSENRPASMTELLSIPAIRALTISGFALNFLNLSFEVVFTLFCYTPVNVGGLGLEPSTIGNTFALAGLIAIVLRVIILPHLLRRFDYAKTYNVCMYIWPVVFGALPFLNLLARTHASTESKDKSVSALLWLGLFTLLAISKVGVIPHSISMLLIKRHAPSRSSLGGSNGLVQLAMCIGRTIAPIAVSSLFTEVNGIGWIRQRGLGWLWTMPMVLGGIAGARVTSEMVKFGTGGC